MRVVVDTSVWSLALRRSQTSANRWSTALAGLIQQGHALLIGPVRQELLSGIKDALQFDRLRDDLRAFPDLRLDTADYEDAAIAFNRCRARGLQGSSTDFLICAVAVRRDLSVFSADADFRRFADVLPLRLYDPVQP